MSVLTAHSQLQRGALRLRWLQRTPQQTLPRSLEVQSRYLCFWLIAVMGARGPQVCECSDQCLLQGLGEIALLTVWTETSCCAWHPCSSSDRLQISVRKKKKEELLKDVPTQKGGWQNFALFLDMQNCWQKRCGFRGAQRLCLGKPLDPQHHHSTLDLVPQISINRGLFWGLPFVC